MSSQPDFNRIAKPYRWLEFLTLGRALERCRLHFLPELAASRNALVLGDGDGRFLAALLAANPHLNADAVDSSAAMLELARQRLGPDADLRLADLASPLPFPDGSFDDVIAALVLHYLRDWTGPLAELRRVLRPGGRLIAAVEHPFAIELMRRAQGGKAAYFETRSRTEEWTFGGHSAAMTFWDRPLHAMTDAFTAAGFRIAVISEPPAAPDTPRELFPPEFEGRMTFLGFLFFVLEAA